MMHVSVRTWPKLVESGHHIEFSASGCSDRDPGACIAGLRPVHEP